MANTSAVYARIDTELKESAESILQQLGISPSSAIQMFYKQIVLTRSMPLNLQLPPQRPTAIGGMTREELDKELDKLIIGKLMYVNLIPYNESTHFELKRSNDFKIKIKQNKTC